MIALALAATWWSWLAGALYVVGPVLGWWLGYRAVRAYYLAPTLPAEQRPPPPSPALWAWLAGMAAMLPILVAGHLVNELGVGAMIKSAIGWAKGWALLALFPLAGHALAIRPEGLARAINRLGRQSLYWLPLFLLAPFIGLPETLWTSPLKVLGGAGDMFFAATLYTIDPESGAPRWQFYAPWSPAMGMVAVCHVLVARLDPDPKWRWTGIGVALLLALLSQSRMALVALAVIVPLSMLPGQWARSRSWAAAAVGALAAGLLAPQLLAALTALADRFTGARADSSRVRATLGRIAIERWQSEGYWVGHGIVERGPHLVEYMPIGSHHSWYGLLFVKGLLGLIALAVPMAVSLVAAMRPALRGKGGGAALGIVLALWLYSFGENLEVLSYLIWPALIAMGALLRPAPARADEGANRRSSAAH